MKDNDDIKTDAAHRAAGAPIAEAMQAYARAGALAFHTPGHKQGLGAHELLRRLITPEGLREEVSLMEELDDLGSPTGCIREAEQLAAELYGADAAYFMINGTTGAIHTMLMAALAPGDVVLVPRNAHRSIIGGLVLCGARPVYMQPETDDRLGIAMGIAPATVRQALADHPEARAVVLVYPTYYGVTVDIAAIAELVHAAGPEKLLLVDEAHGPHLPFSDSLPVEALAAGADMAATSTHKLLGSLTQTSMLLARADRVSLERVQQAAALLQSTSPNQLLLASLDIARLQMQEQGRELVGRAVELADDLRCRINEIDGLWSPDGSYMDRPGASGLDVTKVTVNVRGLGLSGAEAEHILRYEYLIECELSDAYNVLFIISYADTARQTERLLTVLQDMAKRYQRTAAEPLSVVMPPLPDTVLTPREAYYAATEKVPFAAAAGRVAAEQIMFYPPGIPLIVPGDRITQGQLDYIREQQAIGLKVVGPADTGLDTIQVTRD